MIPIHNDILKSQKLGTVPSSKQTWKEETLRDRGTVPLSHKEKSTSKKPSLFQNVETA